MFQRRETDEQMAVSRISVINTEIRGCVPELTKAKILRHTKKTCRISIAFGEIIDSTDLQVPPPERLVYGEVDPGVGQDSEQVWHVAPVEDNALS